MPVRAPALTTEQPRPKATVLVVNDTPSVLYLIGLVLKGAGYHVVEATSGTEALRLAAGRPDRVLLDVHMPDIDGSPTWSRCCGSRAGPRPPSAPGTGRSATDERKDSCGGRRGRGQQGTQERPGAAGDRRSAARLHHQGGLLKGASYAFLGPPGSGKTVLAHQIAFHHVRNGGKVLYVTLLTESHARMLANLEEMVFFDAKVIPQQLQYISGYRELETEGLKGMLELVRRTTRQHEATLLIIDGMDAAKEFARSDLTFKRFLQELQTFVSIIGCTTRLLSPHHEGELHPETTAVDGIFELSLWLAGPGKAAGVGMKDLKKYVDNGLIEIQWQPPLEHNMDALAERLLERIEERKVKRLRLFIDSVAGFRSAAVYPERMPRFFSALSHQLRMLDVTTLYSDETELFSASVETPQPEAAAYVENIILLRHQAGCPCSS